MSIDRVAPTRRPSGKNAGTQKWRNLLFLHWSVPVEVLRPLVPARLTIDTWDGRAWVGLVPFAMQNVKPSWLPGRGLTFLETNVRTYVHLDGRDPGVWFFSLDAASWLAVNAARLGWGLPYFHADMSMSSPAPGGFEYTTSRRSDAANLNVGWRVGDALGPAQPGSLEHFFLERYLLFAQKNDTLLKGQVFHTPYPAHTAELTHLDDQLLPTAGFDTAGCAPELIHASPGVDVEVFALEAL